MEKVTHYRNYRIVEDKDFDDVSTFYVYPEGGDDWGMDHVIECATLADAKRCINECIRDVREYHAGY